MTNNDILRRLRYALRLSNARLTAPNPLVLSIIDKGIPETL